MMWKYKGKDVRTKAEMKMRKIKKKKKAGMRETTVWGGVLS